MDGGSRRLVAVGYRGAIATVHGSDPALALARGVDGFGWFEPLDWVLVRTPLLPLARYLELGESEDVDALSERWPVLRDAEVRRAIAVASPSLFAQLARGAPSRSAMRRRRTATLRYLIRFSTRCTPFGLTAGVSLAGWGEQTDLELGPEEIVRARLDMGLIDAERGARAADRGRPDAEAASAPPGRHTGRAGVPA